MDPELENLKEELFEDQIEYEPPMRVRQERDNLRRQVESLKLLIEELRMDLQRSKTSPNESQKKKTWNAYQDARSKLDQPTSWISTTRTPISITSQHLSQIELNEISFLQKINGQKPRAVKKKYGLK